jgi:hypothetical protein
MRGNVTVVNQNDNADSRTPGIYDTVGALLIQTPFVQNSRKYEKRRIWNR